MGYDTGPEESKGRELNLLLLRLDCGCWALGLGDWTGFAVFFFALAVYLLLSPGVTILNAWIRGQSKTYSPFRGRLCTTGIESRAGREGCSRYEMERMVDNLLILSTIWSGLPLISGGEECVCVNEWAIGWAIGWAACIE